MADIQQPRVDLPDGEARISLAPTNNWNVATEGDFDEFSLWSGVLNPEQLARRSAVGNPPVQLRVRCSGSQVTTFAAWLDGDDARRWGVAPVRACGVSSSASPGAIATASRCCG